MENVLSFCDLTGNMVIPWAEAGYTCWCYDIQHAAGTLKIGNINFVGCDLNEKIELPSPVIISFAFPPCTDLAVSGARWFKSKGPTRLDLAINFVERCANLCKETKAPWMLENPVGRLSTLWHIPNYYFNPCDFGGYLDPIGDMYNKKTCLWTGNGFKFPIKKPVKPKFGSKMHKIPPFVNRANLRSETPMGFARAVFEANRKKEEI